MGTQKRTIVVVMPFGGRAAATESDIREEGAAAKQSATAKRRAILNFKRLEYLVHKCEVWHAGLVQKERVEYDVQVAITYTNEIAAETLRRIDTADILIALILGSNPNVTYEVAYRQIRGRKMILVAESADDVPLYLINRGRQNWGPQTVLDMISEIATRESPILSNFTAEIPELLKVAIDQFNDDLKADLEKALQEIETQFEPVVSDEVLILRGIVSDKCPTFYPSSIVKVSFARDGEFANPDAPAIVWDFDQRFVELYGYTNKPTALADRPLTLGKLLGRIERFCNAGDWAAFLEEQIELTDTIVKKRQFARSSVPLRFNDNHPSLKGKAYLPCVVAQVIDGNLSGAHDMYLLIMYIEIPAAVTGKKIAAKGRRRGSQ